jgi:hypothetical protein
MTGPPGDMTETPYPGRKAGMDALSDVLRVAQLTGGVFLHADFFAPWCVSARVAPEHCAPNLGPASHHLIVYHGSSANRVGNFRDSESDSGM